MRNMARCTFAGSSLPSVSEAILGQDYSENLSTIIMDKTNTSRDAELMCRWQSAARPDTGAVWDRGHGR